MKRKQAYRGMLHPSVFKRSRLPITILFLFFCVHTYAQVPSDSDTYEIRGQVLSAEDDSPLPGVTVQLKNGPFGTKTDEYGAFKLVTSSKRITLTFSYLGYLTIDTMLTLPLTAPLFIIMHQNTELLKHVVVNAGYWQVNKNMSTGNITKVTAEEIEKQPVTNLLAALHGRMTGVYVEQGSGVPGGSFKISIRGQNSLRNSFNNNGNAPLYIVDGVPFISTQLGSSFSATIIDGGNPLGLINPMNIQSIEILKDADATAIYGSRGANGVVLITTKKGNTGKVQLAIDMYHGFGEVSNKMHLLNTQQYLEMRKDALEADNRLVGPADHDLNGNWETTSYTDWQEVLLGGTANLSNAQISLSGGNTTTSFRMGLGYIRETTVFPGNFSNKKFSGSLNLNHRSANRRVHVDISGNYLIDNNNLLRIDHTRTALTLPPNAPSVYDDHGNLNWADGTWDNPLGRQKQRFSARSASLIANALIKYRLARGLDVKANLGYTDLRYDENTRHPKAALNPESFTAPSASFTNKLATSWIIEPQIEYGIRIGKGKLSSLIGTTFYKDIAQGQVLSATGFSSDALLRNLQAASEIAVSSLNSSVYRYNAVFGRLNYNWKSKYIANLTGRRDGSSRFGPGRKFANFGALGVAWIFSNETLFEDKLSFVSFGKLRTSYGVTGSDQIGDYNFLGLWNTTKYNYGGLPGLVPNNLTNPNLAWEENKQFEIAMELGLLDDRIHITTSYFRTRSGNQLVGIPLPLTTGFGSVQANFPAIVLNKGVEFEFHSVNFNSSRFTWSTSLNLTIPKNELVSFPDIESSSFRYDYSVGRSLGIKPAYHYTGIDAETGVYTYEDVNGDGSYSFVNDYLALKSIEQAYFGGFQNSVRYKAFQLDIFFQFVKQTGVGYLNVFTSPPGTMSNQPYFVTNRWKRKGDHSNIQKYTSGFGPAYTAFFMAVQSDMAIVNASFIRLKNLSFSYLFEPSITGIESARFYVHGQNLVTITPYKGLDPETQSAALPPLRMLTAGIQLTF